jgi:hypothetical protein
MPQTAKHTRLQDNDRHWKHWGPYLNERQWGQSMPLRRMRSGW